ncbi:MAG TPA: hypothetical protein VF695_15905 [Sphingomonas sp.]
MISTASPPLGRKRVAEARDRRVSAREQFAHDAGADDDGDQQRCPERPGGKRLQRERRRDVLTCLHLLPLPHIRLQRQEKAA